MSRFARFLLLLRAFFLSLQQAGESVKYLWADGVKIKKPIECSAPEYVDYLMSWVESQLNDGQTQTRAGLERCACSGTTESR